MMLLPALALLCLQAEPGEAATQLVYDAPARSTGPTCWVAIRPLELKPGQLSSDCDWRPRRDGRGSGPWRRR